MNYEMTLMTFFTKLQLKYFKRWTQLCFQSRLQAVHLALMLYKLFFDEVKATVHDDEWAVELICQDFAQQDWKALLS